MNAYAGREKCEDLTRMSSFQSVLAKPCRGFLSITKLFQMFAYTICGKDIRVLCRATFLQGYYDNDEHIHGK